MTTASLTSSTETSQVASLDRGWIDQCFPWSRSGRVRPPRGLNVARAQDMKHRLSSRDQIISDNSPMASPPHGFRAHHSAALRVPELPQLGETGTEGVGHGVVGIVVKGLVLPEGVDRRRDVPRLGSQPSERSDVGIADFECGQCLGKHVAVVLGVRARSRNGPDINDELNLRWSQQIDEILDRSGRMSNGKERMRHGFHNTRRRGAMSS